MTTYDPAIHEVRPITQSEKPVKLQQSGQWGIFSKLAPAWQGGLYDPDYFAGVPDIPSQINAAMDDVKEKQAILNTPLPGAFNALAFWGNE